MTTALIGTTGFVGKNLRQQRHFDAFYHSKNCDQIKHQAFDEVICAGAPAEKWKANQHPTADENNIQALIDNLKTIKCQRFVLISTVDVFENPTCINEQVDPALDNLHAYGKNRFKLEAFAKSHFKNVHIIRLPGLVGNHLKKNIIYDLHHNNNLEAINPSSHFQFYPIDHLARDIDTVVKHNLRLVHLTAEPISVNEIAQTCFNITLQSKPEQTPEFYDIRSLHTALFTQKGIDYHYTKAESIAAICNYRCTETSITAGL